MIEPLRAPPSLAWATPGRVAAFWLASAIMFAVVGVLAAALAYPWNRLAMGLAATGFALLLSWTFTRRRALSATDAGMAWRRSSIAGDCSAPPPAGSGSGTDGAA